MDIFGWLIVWAICAFIAGVISSLKGRSYGEGFMIGLLLGILGVLIVTVLPKNEQGLEQEKLKDGTGKRCLYCAEVIKKEAAICRFCGKELPIMAKALDDVDITKEEFAKLTYRQRYTITEYGYLLSKEGAETVGKMLGSLMQTKDIIQFCKENGRKVNSFEVS